MYKPGVSFRFSNSSCYSVIATHKVYSDGCTNQVFLLGFQTLHVKIGINTSKLVPGFNIHDELLGDSLDLSVNLLGF